MAINLFFTPRLKQRVKRGPGDAIFDVYDSRRSPAVSSLPKNLVRVLSRRRQRPKDGFHVFRAESSPSLRGCRSWPGRRLFVGSHRRRFSQILLRSFRESQMEFELLHDLHFLSRVHGLRLHVRQSRARRASRRARMRVRQRRFRMRHLRHLQGMRGRIGSQEYRQSRTSARRWSFCCCCCRRRR